MYASREKRNNIEVGKGARDFAPGRQGRRESFFNTEGFFFVSSAKGSTRGCR